MRFLFLFIVKLILVSHLAADQNVAITTSLIQHYLAKNPQDSINQWDEIMLPAAKELVRQLPFSAEANSMQEAILKVLSTVKPLPFTLEQKNLNRENEPKRLYFAFEGNHGLFVVKVYENNSTLFLSDFWGQQCAHDLILTAVKVPSILTVGKIGVGTENYLIIVEEYLSGLSFNELIQNSKVNLSEAFFQLGRGLKDYHAQSSYSTGHLTPPFQTYVNKVIDDGLKAINENDRSWLKSIIENLSKKMMTKQFKTSYVHSDPNFGNFLLDKNRLAMIDFEDAGKYIDAKKLGLATPAFDLVMLIDYIDGLTLLGRSTQEVQCLKKAFLDGYGPLPYDQEEYLYFSIVDLLNAVVWFQAVHQDLTEKRKAEVAMTIKRKLDKIKALSL